ncbi:MAG: hypothetical protein HN368_00005 [Spirochaetales bacterium]|jgi:hypothetical protein|nr:hypothetical protein [Spirochaetales bacterium]
MKNQICRDLAVHYRIACSLIKKVAEAFSSSQWVSGLSAFETPVNVAFHTVDCLDFYFRGYSHGKYIFGHRFGGGWWELADENKPSIGDLITYLDEIDTRIAAFFASKDDAHLYEKYNDDHSNMSWYLYALRHTLHHQGGLNALAAFHKIDVEGWDE